MKQSSPLSFSCGILVLVLSALEGSSAGQDVADDSIGRATSALPAQNTYQQTRAMSWPDGEMAFVVGNIEYLLVHEIAHLLIAEKNIPIIGPVENAADYIATLALIREEPLDPAQRDRAEGFLRAAAGAFSASWQTGRALDAEVPYWGAHALSIQRYYQIVCLLYGSDPTAFADVLEDARLAEAKGEGCIVEYARADRAVDWLLLNYGRKPGDPPGAATEIIYGRPPTTVSTGVLRELKSSELLERVVGRLHERFTIEQPFQLVMRRCGRSEAAWISERRELVICYELVDTLYLLGRRANALKHAKP
jgi:hypothetical protein